MRPRVVIDIASLGYAQRRKSHARGVHRVAHHIVIGLLEANQCDLHFVATSSLAGAYEWLRESGLSTAETLSYRQGQLWLSRWADRTGHWIERTLPDRRIHMRATRWLLQRLVQTADAQAAKISPNALRGADIYHSMLAPIPAAVRARTDIKHFLTVVDVIPLTNPTSVGGRGVPLLKKQLDSLTPHSFAFCISETVKEELLSVTGLTSQQVFVTPLAASRETFYPVTDRRRIETALKAYNIPDKPYFLTLSSFDPRKNFEHIIRCFDALVKAGSLADCTLVIVGSNPERNTHVARILQEMPETRKKIVTPGYIADCDLATIYSGAIAFLFPSLSEGFGIPVLEAMQCGTPVISSDAPALPEVVGDGGILLDPRDVSGWCDAMVRLSRDAVLREGIRERGLQRSSRFSWEQFIEATLAGYRTSLENVDVGPI